MKLSSAQAAKLLRKLNEDLHILRSEETASSRFTAATTENIENARPAYDFAAMQAKKDVIEAKIRAVKHAINVFNTTHTLPEFGMTIDECLIYMPQLSERKRLLGEMACSLEKERNNNMGHNSVIEYTYANYSIAEARAELDRVSDLLSSLQMALDIANSQSELEIDI